MRDGVGIKETGKGRDYNRPMKLELTRLLGGMTPEKFLADYWQKKPLLVRGAAPGIEHLLTRDALLQLATRDDMESRFVSQTGGWQLRHGPFSAHSLKRSAKPWTVLVQSVNLALEAGDALQRNFDFIPYARLDDLMVSYATDGGGVGPHFDSYDVFLLQGMGRRRWRIGKQKDQTLIEGLPVRILKDFRPTQDLLLEPGDLLYLPPEWAHDGTAEGECMTLSVGFRAPPAQELAEQFLMFLQDHICLQGRYADPDLKRQKHPAEIGAAMIDQVTELLTGVRWNRQTIRDFLGASLSEPKSHVIFESPSQPLSLAKFLMQARKYGIRLDARSQLLFSGKHFYLNGEKWPAPPPAAPLFPLLRMLADRRCTPVLADFDAATDAALSPLHEAYCDGFLHLQQ
jgi:50S ribosomal protein L16 3-hydroxylase